MRIMNLIKKRGAIMKRHAISTSGVIGAIVIICMFCLAPPAFAGYEDSLKGYWKFDATSDGVTLDATGSNNGQVYGGTSFDAGKFGNAASFDGIDGYIKTNSGVSVSGTTPRTEVIWVKAAQAENYYNVFSCIGTDGAGTGFGLWSELGKFYFWGSNSDIPTNVTVTDNQWHQLASTFDGSSVSLYVDGAYVTSSNMALNTPATEVYFGKPSHAPGFYLDGAIDDAGIWNRALDANEVEAIYLVGIYKFEALKHALDGLSLTYTTAELLDMAELEAGLAESATLGGAITFVRSTLDDSVWTGQGWTVGSHKYDSEDGLWFIYDEGMVGGSGMVPSDANPGAPDGDGLEEHDDEGDGVPEPSAVAVGGIAIGLLGLLKRMRKNTES